VCLGGGDGLLLALLERGAPGVVQHLDVAHESIVLARVLLASSAPHRHLVEQPTQRRAGQTHICVRVGTAENSTRTTDRRRERNAGLP